MYVATKTSTAAAMASPADVISIDVSGNFGLPIFGCRLSQTTLNLVICAVFFFGILASSTRSFVEKRFLMILLNEKV